MAGNTKFMGFGNDNHVTLERWGKSTSVSLTPETVDILRVACFKELPREPPKQSPLPFVDVKYDPYSGSAEIRLSQADTGALCKFLQDSPATEGPFDKALMIVALQRVMAEHQQYLDTFQEPGVE